MLKKITNAIPGIIVAAGSLFLIAYCAVLFYKSYQFEQAGLVKGSCAETPFVHQHGESPRISNELYAYSDEYATKRIGRIDQFHFFKVLDRSGSMIKVVKYQERENKDAPSYWVKRDSLQFARHLVCKS